MTRFLTPLLLVGLLSGCAEVVVHEARTSLVTPETLESLQGELRALTLEALEPATKSIAFTEDGFDYVFEQYDPLRETVAEYTGEVVYSEVDTARVYENRRVLLSHFKERKPRRRKRQRLATFRFKTLEDAIRWADLVVSLKTHSEAGEGE